MAVPRDLAQRLARKARLGKVLGATNHPDALAALYGGTDKRAHGYMPHYRRHLGPRRGKRNLVFEIGVGGYDSSSPGGSLALWRDYLFLSTIVGVDIHWKSAKLGPRVHLVQGDQSDSKSMQSLVTDYGRPDVIIDDGSHVGEHVIASFTTLWPLVRAGGLYVIEDLSTSYYPSFGGSDPPPARSALGLAQLLLDDVQALDATFFEMPEWGRRRPAVHDDVMAVHCYPGIVFAEKA